MGMPINLHYRGSFPGPLNGGYVSFDGINNTGVSSGAIEFVWLIPFNFKLSKVLVTDFGCTASDGTIQIAHTPISAEAAATAIASFNVQVLASSDYDTNRNANGYLTVGAGSEPELSFASEGVRLVPKDSFFKVKIGSATSTITAPITVSVLGYPYGHAFVSPSDD